MPESKHSSKDTKRQTDKTADTNPVQQIRKTNLTSLFQRLYNDKKLEIALSVLYFILGIYLQMVLKTPNPVIFICAIVLTYILILIAFHTAHVYESHASTIGISFLILLCLICFTAYRLIYPTSDFCDNPITLYEHFNCDFRSSLILSDTETILINKESVKIDEQLHSDSTHYDFVCYHIPDTTTTLSVCQYLLDNTSSIIDKIKDKYKRGKIHSPKEPLNLSHGGSSPSGIYIYCEQVLSDSDKNWIDSVGNYTFSNNCQIIKYDKNSFK